MSPVVTEAIRKELRRTTGQRVESDELARIIRETMLREECLEPAFGSEPEGQSRQARRRRGPRPGA
jgi:hypothetical protein